jgi:hypothetical protein
MRAGNGILENRPKGTDEDDEDRRQPEGGQNRNRIGNINRRRYRPGNLGERQEHPLQPQRRPHRQPRDDAQQRRQGESGEQDGQRRQGSRPQFRQRFPEGSGGDQWRWQQRVVAQRQID